MRSLLTLHLRQAVRGLRRNPTFTIAVLLTLALAIGANTAVFSVVNGVLINPMPYPEPESLVDVLTQAPGAPNAPGASGGITNMPESASMYVTYAENNQSFESLGVFQPFPLNVAIADTSEQIRGVAISRGVLESLRVPPMLGRAFTDADYHAGGPDAVILGWGYWQRRFGGDPSVVGRTYDASMTRTSFALVMLGIAAGMALVLGLVGIYGMVAYVATRRTREVGIRLTLGAQQREIRGMLLRHGFVLTSIGIAIGLGAAAAVMRVMTSLLFDVSPVDPLTYVAVALLLMTATLLASYIPARRISRVDPAVAMRVE